ncbi:hypothetical protein SAMN05421868_13456 [Paenibacillus naphthalenovorans]|nr:hypothetical protein SAMN05421868_13456 [Paenibacillus naphthalenovorans]
MKLRVILEREYEIDYELEELGFDSIDDIVGMEEIDVLDDHAKVTTTWFKSAELVDEKAEESSHKITCIFCNGQGKFWHICGKKFECYCVSVKKLKEAKK